MDAVSSYFQLIGSISVDFDGQRVALSHYDSLLTNIQLNKHICLCTLCTLILVQKVPFRSIKKSLSVFFLFLFFFVSLIIVRLGRDNVGDGGIFQFWSSNVLLRHSVSIRYNKRNTQLRYFRILQDKSNRFRISISA